MTIDEAIKHAEEVAEEQDKLCKRYDDASRYSRSHNKDIVSDNAKKCLECFECAKEHRQLAEWLKDYKRLKEQEPKTMVEIDLYSVIKQKYIEREVLDKIRAEIETKCCITVGRENDGAITLHDVFEIINKYKAESEDKDENKT